MDPLGVHDSIAGISAALTQRLKEEGLKQFNEAHQKWQEEEERKANRYTWIPAWQLGRGVTICEQGFKTKKMQRFHVTELLPPESKYDRHVKVIVDKSKTWRYEPDELVMVLA